MIAAVAAEGTEMKLYGGIDLHSHNNVIVIDTHAHALKATAKLAQRSMIVDLGVSDRPKRLGFHPRDSYD
jgi:hypothetical protein